MRERLFVLFWEDRPTRLRMYAFTLVMSLLMGVASSANGKSGVEWDVAGTALISLLLWTVIYCGFSYKSKSPTPDHSKRYFAFSGITLACVMAVGIGAKRVEAAIVTRKLRKYIEESPGQSEVTEVGNLLELARKNRVPVSADLISDVGSKLIQIVDSNRAAPQTVTSAYRAVETAASLRSDILDVIVRTDLRPALFGAHFKQSLFEGLRLQDVSITLDTNQFLDCYIENCTIGYEGGPVLLKNTTFFRCNFRFFSESPATRQLLSSLTKTGTPDFSFMVDQMPSQDELRRTGREISVHTK
jgi:hypothetical protein